MKGGDSDVGWQESRPGEIRAVEVGDLAHARTRGFVARVSAALDVLREAAAIGPLGVSYSGGKDSTVLLDLVRQVAPDAPAAFFDSGCEYPGTYEMVAHYGAQVIEPQMSLIEMCKYGGYWGHPTPVDPDATFDFFSYLVAEPSARFVAEHGLRVLCMGLRGQESKGRGLSARRRGTLYQVKTGLWHCCPLAFWGDADIWAYIAARGLRYNPAYDKMARAGVPRRQWRVGILLGVTRPGLQERYGWLRQIEPEVFYRLAADFPKILRYT